MNSVPEALNTLISAVNVAQNKGGVYSLEEAHHIFTAISYLNSLQNQGTPTEESADNSKETPVTPSSPSVTESPEALTDAPQQGY